MQGRCYSRWQLNGPSGEPIYWLPHHRMVSQYSYIWRVSVINLRWKFRGAELVPKFSLYFSATFQLHIQTCIQKTEFGFCFLALKIKNKSGHQNFWSKVRKSPTSPTKNTNNCRFLRSQETRFKVTDRVYLFDWANWWRLKPISNCSLYSGNWGGIELWGFWGWIKYEICSNQHLATSYIEEEEEE